MPPAEAENSAAVRAPESLNGTESESVNVWPDEAAEAAFIAEARERGEPVGAAAARPPDDEVAAAEAIDAKNLPSLDDLVKRIPPDVREALDDLFRVKFTVVRRIPAKVLKP